MQKKILALALALVLAFAMIPSAFAAESYTLEHHESTLTFSNVSSTGTEFPKSWHEELLEEADVSWDDAEIKAYYFDSAPVTLNFSDATSIYWWWRDGGTSPDENFTSQTVEFEDAYWNYDLFSGTLTITDPGTYLVAFRGGSPAIFESLVGCYFMVGGDTSAPAPAPQDMLTVNPTASTVYVNGEATAFEAYLIGDNNYFKLRDLALAVSGSDKQFEIGYDAATGAITMTSGQPYTEVGGEMAQGDGSSKSAMLNSAINIAKDGDSVAITAYLIDGNNFVKLRDVMSLFDIYVGYDSETKAITVDTSKGYEAE